MNEENLFLKKSQVENLERVSEWSFSSTSLYPMLSVHFFVRFPFASEEGIAGADDLTVEKSRQSRILFSQTFDFEVA